MNSHGYPTQRIILVKLWTRLDPITPSSGERNCENKFRDATSTPVPNKSLDIHGEHLQI
jgi:hypothetical protein